MAEFFDMSNIGYIGGAAGVLVVLYLLWRFFVSSRGRIAEEQEEEAQTAQLANCEKKAENAERDERKQCRKLGELFKKIMGRLDETKRGNISDSIALIQNEIIVMLGRLEEERMSVDRALATFRKLHSAINEFLPHLPANDGKISKWVGKIQKHQKSYYNDLINEAVMDKKKRELLRKLWTEEMEQERGAGDARAA